MKSRQTNSANYYCHNCHTYFEEPESRSYDDLHAFDSFADPWSAGTSVYVCPECGSEEISEVG